MRILVLCLCACAASAATPPPAAPAAAAACASPEHRQLDFWIGQWDVRVRARASPASDQWGEGRGTQRIESILGGCAIAESFAADGPQQPWAGRSYSSWQPQLGTWRQSWVDDSGGFIALTGGVERGEMTLYGEPRTVKDQTVQMRMVFQRVARDSLHWEWQRSTDQWATHTTMIEIEYQRRR
jgi:hypothetical protein